MALEEVDKVDAIGLDERAGEAILTIADAWDWLDERAHLLALQAKLNAYFGFIESGEVFETYPQAVGRRLVIDIVGRCRVPAGVAPFYARATECAAELGVELRTRRCPGRTGGGGENASS